jgi:membrane protein DedA with SNARE-associated domain/rhodanese-related sulfurtransferase
MHLPDSFANFGYAGLFLWIFLEQIGLPVPAFPVLVAAGAFVSSGKLGLGQCLLVTVGASLVADLVWYYLGRVRGAAVLNLLCRLSWKPDTCITSTRNLFGRHGAKTLLFAKFVPGLNTVAPPLAGVVGIPLGRFTAYDSAGAAIWGLTALGLGMGMRDALPVLLHGLRDEWPVLIVAGLGLFALWRFLRRRAFVRLRERERKRGITPEELNGLLERGEEVVILDTRHPIDLGGRPVALPGARTGFNAIAQRSAEIPLEKALVTYCACPKDEGAVGAVAALHRLGARSARVLRGGLDEWEKRGYPLDTLSSPLKS